MWSGCHTLNGLRAPYFAPGKGDSPIFVDAKIGTVPSFRPEHHGFQPAFTTRELLATMSGDAE